MPDPIDSPAEVFAWLLAKKNLGVWDSQGLGPPITAPLLPDAPLRALALASSAPARDGRIMRTGRSVIHPVVSLMIRDPNYENAWKLAQSIVDEMALVQRELLELPGGDKVIAACSLQTGPTDLGSETDSGAFLISVSFSFTYG